MLALLPGEVLEAPFGVAVPAAVGVGPDCSPMAVALPTPGLEPVAHHSCPVASGRYPHRRRGRARGRHHRRANLGEDRTLHNAAGEQREEQRRDNQPEGRDARQGVDHPPV